MSTSTYFSKILNWVSLGIELFLLILALLSKISYGHGLGNLLFMGLNALFLVIHLLFILKKLKEENPIRHLIVGFVFLFNYSSFMNKMSFGRGPENPWNGNIFSFAQMPQV